MKLVISKGSYQERKLSVVRPSVASENRDRQFFVLGSLKTSQSLMSNDAMIIHDNNVVGAGLVPAHDVVLSDDGSIVGTSDHDVVPVNTRATTRVAPTLGHVIGTYKSLVTTQPFNCFFSSWSFPVTHHPSLIAIHGKRSQAFY